MIRSAILMIDDEPVVNTFYRRALKAAGYNVTMASSGAEGIDTVHTLRPELVITDIMMPGMSGFEFCEKLCLANEKRMPILFLTANDGLKTVRDGLNAGGDDFLAKGKDISILRERIDFWLHAALHGLPDIPRKLALSIIESRLNDSDCVGQTPIAELQAIRGIDKKFIHEKIMGVALESAEYAAADGDMPLALIGYLSGMIEELTADNLSMTLRYPDYLEAALVELDPKWELKIRALYSSYNTLSREEDFLAGQSRGREIVRRAR